MERWLWRIGVGLGTASVGALVWLPLRVAWVLVGAWVVTATVVGPLVLRPRTRQPWHTIALGMGCFAAANLWDLLLDPYERGGIALVVSSVLYLVGYLVLGVACTRLVRTRLPAGDPEGRIDGWLVTVAIATVLVDAALAPGGGDGTVLFAHLTYVAVPLLTAAVMASAIRVLFTGAHRNVAAWLLVGAAASGLAANAVYVLGHDTSTPLTTAAWLLAYVLVAVASLHPSMRELSRPAEPSEVTSLPFGRLVVIGLALTAVPATMLRAPGPAATRVPAIAALLCVVLVLWRMTRLLRERESAAALLRHRALHDALTGLPNRASITERLEGAVERAVTTGNPLVVLFLDLDGFKAVNDTLGHGAGDQLLAEVADRLRRNVRVHDVVGRLAGDEFVVVCEPAPADASDLAQGLLDAVAAPFELELGDAIIGVSIGLATAHAGDTPDSLLRRADEAMYRAKHAGKGRIAICTHTAVAGV
ncbi:diguanylate cyclase domain-containing protein [Egicoccus sp. AB-alg6-2]|uniref:diguanylate cyclase domain-containing protein n=1 Tax=Egicoccus sp. AB-alg6-2 TaxID=3242692 RepID=UPI00359E819F